VIALTSLEKAGSARVQLLLVGEEADRDGEVGGDWGGDEEGDEGDGSDADGDGERGAAAGAVEHAVRASAASTASCARDTDPPVAPTGPTAPTVRRGSPTGAVAAEKRFSGRSVSPRFSGHGGVDNVSAVAPTGALRRRRDR
jgi:hypothetical protein